MDENSSVCELLTGNQLWRPGFHAVYNVAPSLYKLKGKLENHLCKKTDNLFNITNRIAIFDLTYAELKIIPTNDRNRLMIIQQISHWSE